MTTQKITKALAGFLLTGERDKYDLLVKLLRTQEGGLAPKTTKMEVAAMQEALRLGLEQV